MKCRPAMDKWKLLLFRLWTVMHTSPLQNQLQYIYNCMNSFQKLTAYLQQSVTLLQGCTSTGLLQLTAGIEALREQQKQVENGAELGMEGMQGQGGSEGRLGGFEGLEQLELIESRAVQNEAGGSPKEGKKRRVREIEEEKKKIAEELRLLDQEIEEIKGETSANGYKKRQKIHKDPNAQRQAESLVKQLKNQRKQLQLRRKQQMQKALLQMQKEDQQRRIQKQQQLLAQKEQRRLAIAQRMQQQKRRREERKLIEAQSNQLIAKLKKQEELEKLAAMPPTQLIEQPQKRKPAERKNNIDFREIEEHDRKYRELKQKSKKQKEERAMSLKMPKPQKIHRNIWIDRLEQEQQKKREEERANEQRKRLQLEKRLKYGELVKNIFLPKRKQNQANQLGNFFQKGNHDDEEVNHRTQPKPKTPQELPSIPKSKAPSNKTQNSKMYNDESLPGIRNSKKVVAEKPVKQFDADEEQKQKQRKIRQLQLRKQTKQRLKKMQNISQTKNNGQQDKKKYKNYLGEVKIKKDDSNDWKRIISNQKLTQEQKYQELIKKAGDLEAKAKKKEDKGTFRQADEDAVNLYIGSIQAKLALLEKF